MQDYCLLQNESRSSHSCCASHGCCVAISFHWTDIQHQKTAIDFCPANFEELLVWQSFHKTMREPIAGLAWCHFVLCILRFCRQWRQNAGPTHCTNNLQLEALHRLCHHESFMMIQIGDQQHRSSCGIRVDNMIRMNVGSKLAVIEVHVSGITSATAASNNRNWIHVHICTVHTVQNRLWSDPAH